MPLALILDRFRKRFASAHAWPAGEPVLFDGERIGTRVAPGAVVYAPGVRVTGWPLCACGEVKREASLAAAITKATGGT